MSLSRFEIRGNPRDGYMLFFDGQFMDMYGDHRDAVIAKRAAAKLLELLLNE